jgi:hypothetical protein
VSAADTINIGTADLMGGTSIYPGPPPTIQARIGLRPKTLIIITSVSGVWSGLPCLSGPDPASAGSVHYVWGSRKAEAVCFMWRV